MKFIEIVTQGQTASGCSLNTKMFVTKVILIQNTWQIQINVVSLQKQRILS